MAACNAGYSLSMFPMIQRTIDVWALLYSKRPGTLLEDPVNGCKALWSHNSQHLIKINKPKVPRAEREICFMLGSFRKGHGV